MHKMMGALLVAAMVAPVALPAQAALTESPSSLPAVLLKSTGEVVYTTMDQFQNEYPDGLVIVTCSGDAPFENRCTLTGHTDLAFGYGIVVGAKPGSWQGTPVGTVQMSVYYVLNGSNGGQYEWGCNYLVNRANAGSGLTLMCALVAGYGGLRPSGDLTATLHAGVWEPAFVQEQSCWVPGPCAVQPMGMNTIEQGVGNWFMSLATA